MERVKVKVTQEVVSETWNAFLDLYKEDRPNMSCPFIVENHEVFYNTPSGNIKLCDLGEECAILPPDPDGLTLVFEDKGVYFCMHYDWFENKTEPELQGVSKTEYLYHA